MADSRGWVPVALSSAIEAATSAGAVIDGAEVVVWRDNKGAAHVWEDRCPHRGMRMSFGFVRGDHIACLYHGWQYDTGGQCQYIPAHPGLDVPKTIKIPTYAVEERLGVIWTCLAEDADAGQLPVVEGAFSPIRSLYVDCPAADLAKRLSDAVLPGSDMPASLEILTDTAVLLTGGDLRLLVAVQSIAPDRSGLHLVALGATELTTVDRKLLAKWAGMLRLSLEAPAPLATEAA